MLDIIKRQKTKLEEKKQKLNNSLAILKEWEAYENKRYAVIEKFRELLNWPIPDIKFEASSNSLTVLKKRYLKKDENGNILETPEKRLWDTAVYVSMGRAVADPKETSDAIFKRAEKYFKAMAARDFMPNSPTLMNAGKELGQLSACFVLPVEDDTESIFDGVKNTALIHKSGGGTGFSFSRIRPKNDKVVSTNGVASGPVSFMRVFDAATEEIKQGGTRRGANMGILHVTHPDILEFIECKRTGGINNFNISVGITEEFMRLAEEGKEYDLINPKTKEVVGKLNAAEVLNKIIEGAWRNGEPGIVFIDRLNKDNPTPNLGAIESTNPCGEQPLLPYESCNLGSINLTNFVRGNSIDFERLKEITRLAVEFLNDVIDINFYPLPQIWEMTVRNRKIGLGVMGLADMFARLGIKYDSEKALETAERVMEAIHSAGWEMSRKMAEKYGEFPNFKGSIFDERKEKPSRNATITTIAPTGTISIIAGVSSGIEPFFAISFVRKQVLDGAPMLENNPEFVGIAREKGFYSEELMQEIAKTGKVAGNPNVPKEIQNVFVTALEISPEWHIRMQAVFQKYTDNAVSKTVNFAESATKEDIIEAYRLAYKLGCKGVTVYRDKSRQAQVLNVGEQKAAGTIDMKITELNALRRIAYGEKDAEKRGKVLPAFIIKEPVGSEEKIYCTLAYRMGKVWEIFTSSKTFDATTYELIKTNAIHISRRLQGGENPLEIADDLIGTPGPAQGHDKFGTNLSTSDAVGRSIAMDRFKGLEDFDKKLAEAMIDLEILLLRGLISTYNKRVEKAELIADYATKLNGQGKRFLMQMTLPAGGMPRKPCPGCGSTAYTTMMREGCEFNTCCYYSPKCS